MKILVSLSNSTKKLNKNVMSALLFLLTKTNKHLLTVDASLQDKTLTVIYKTSDSMIKSKLGIYVLETSIAEEFNLKYGSDFTEGVILSRNSEGIKVQYTAESTLGKILE